MEEILLWKNKSVPRGFHIYSARVNNSENGGCFYHGSGASFDKETAQKKAICECIERFCGSKVPRRLLTETHLNLFGQSYNPSKLIPFLEKQYNSKKFPYKRYRPDFEIDWVRGISLIDQRKVYIPAFSVYLGYNFSIPLGQRFAPISSCGLAVQRTYNKAIIKGILEFIECDAAMRLWLQKKRTYRINLSNVKSRKLQNLLRIVQDEGLKAEVLFATQHIPIPSVIGIIYSSTVEVPYATFGLAAGLDIEDVMLKSLEEALMVRNTLIQLKEENRFVDFRGGCSQIKTFLDHAFYYSSPKSKRYWLYLLKMPLITPVQIQNKFDAIDLKTNTLHKLVNFVEEAGCKEILVVDLTNSMAKAMDLHCARVIIPGLFPIEMDYNLKFLKYDRINAIRRLNNAPHPFT